MAYIVGTDRNQSRMITASLDDLIDKDNSVRAIDAYVNSLNLTTVKSSAEQTEVSRGHSSREVKD